MGKNKNTLISQFYGLHRVKVRTSTGKTRTHHFVIMNNLFPPNAILNLTYDLKGSTAGRYTLLQRERRAVHLKTRIFRIKSRDKIWARNPCRIFQTIGIRCTIPNQEWNHGLPVIIRICNSKTGHSNRDQYEDESTP